METTTTTTSLDDRISELPDPLIHQILSLLDMESAVQTSVLSKRWRYAWTCLPTLSFNSNIFFRRNCRHKVSFLGFINMFLQDSSFDLQRLCMDFSNAPQKGASIINQLNTWILRALRRNVQDLYLSINYRMKFKLLPCVFNSKSLTKLELVMEGSTERWCIVLPDSMDLPQLESLKLVRILLYDVNKIISSCPVLESLIMEYCDITSEVDNNIDISSVKLKHFELSNCELRTNWYNWPSCWVNCIRLYAPNLTSFVCRNSMSQDYSLEHLSSLVIADICMSIKGRLFNEEKQLYAKRVTQVLKGIHNAKQLTLSFELLEVFSGVSDLLESRPPQFSNLRFLKLDMRLSRGCLWATTYLLKLCPNIQFLSLTIADQSYSEKIGDDWEADSSFPSLLHHLKVIKVRGVKGCLKELKILEFLLKNALVLQQLSLFSMNAYTFDKVKKMSKKLLHTLPRDSSSIDLHVS